MTRHRIRLVASFMVAVLAIPGAPVFAERNRRDTGGSVRQSRNNSRVSTNNNNVNRNVNRNNTNVNRNVNNVNVNRNVNNVNVNRNVNVNSGYRRGAVAVGEEGAVAVGRRGAVAVGEEGFVGVGRHGAVVAGSGERYESYEGWKVAAGVAGGVAAGIAIGTMLATPPRASTTVVVSGTNYMYADGAYYEQVYYGGSVSYRVVAAPPAR